MFIFFLSPYICNNLCESFLSQHPGLGLAWEETRLTWDGGICHQQAIGYDAQETPIGGLQDDFATIPVHTEKGVRLQGVPISYDGLVAPLEKMWGSGTRSKVNNLRFFPISFSAGPHSHTLPFPSLCTFLDYALCFQISLFLKKYFFSIYLFG